MSNERKATTFQQPVNQWHAVENSFAGLEGYFRFQLLFLEEIDRSVSSKWGIGFLVL